MTSPFISIQLNSNRPRQIVEFFDSVESTADKPEEIEILLHIDTGDTVMEELTAREKEKRKFSLRILQTDLVKSYATLWKPLNPLFKMTHPDAYFVANLFDELEFATKGWDTLLRSYVGYYPDHIFRLRGSKYRFRNYEDFWECGFAPDSMAFYTRKWLELQGDWNPCLGPDSFQQCVAFYLFTSDKFSHTQYNRDIALPEIQFIGEGAGIGLEGEAKFRRMCINNRAWFILMSQEMQQEAKRRAMRLKSHIIAQEKKGYVEENEKKHYYTIKNNISSTLIATVPYGVSWWGTTARNWLRSPILLYYTGGGKEALRIHKIAGILLMVSTYYPSGAKVMNAIEHARVVYYQWRGRMRHPINHIKGVSKTKLLHFISRIQYAFGLANHPQKIVQHTNSGRIRAFLKNVLYNSETKQIGLKKLIVKSKRILLIIPAVPMANGYEWVRRNLAKLLPPSVKKILKPLDNQTRGFFSSLIKKLDKPKATFIRITLSPQFQLPLIKLDIFLSYILYKTFCFFLRPLLLLAITGINYFRLIKRKCYKLTKKLPEPLKKILRMLLMRSAKADNIQWLNTETSVSKALDTIICSVQLSSNRPHRVLELIDNIERTAHHPEQIEVLVHIDKGDDAIENMLIAEQKNRKVRIKYLQTDLVKGFTHLWKAYNPLFALTHPQAKYVTLLSDEMRFETVGWDDELLKYDNYYPDNIFRLRGSKYRFRNYTDYWECGFAPDSIAFYTRKWLAIQGDWNPCTGPDSFQQLVSFYLFTNDPFCHTQYNRDIALPLLQFSGEGAGVGLEGAAQRKRIRDNNRAWFVLMSAKMQREAKRRAMLIKANIIARGYQKENPSSALAFCCYNRKNMIIIENSKGEVIERLSYKVPSITITLTNWLRAPLVHYYAGGGVDSLKRYPFNGIKMMTDTYFPRIANLYIAMSEFNSKYNPMRNRHRHKINHLKGMLKEHGFLKTSTMLFKRLSLSVKHSSNFKQ